MDNKSILMLCSVDSRFVCSFTLSLRPRNSLTGVYVRFVLIVVLSLYESMLLGKTDHPRLLVPTLSLALIVLVWYCLVWAYFWVVVATATKIVGKSSGITCSVTKPAASDLLTIRSAWRTSGWFSLLNCNRPAEGPVLAPRNMNRRSSIGIHAREVYAR